jgi:hypothetical protein
MPNIEMGSFDWPIGGVFAPKKCWLVLGGSSSIEDKANNVHSKNCEIDIIINNK